MCDPTVTALRIDPYPPSFTTTDGQAGRGLVSHPDVGLRPHRDTGEPFRILSRPKQFGRLESLNKNGLVNAELIFIPATPY